MVSQASIIETQNLKRYFKLVKAVDSISVSIQPGELFGLVGPDGAGKTTTLRLLAGLLDITEGTAQILGYDIQDQTEQIKPKIGYMAQQFSLYEELSVYENLTFFADLFQVATDLMPTRISRLLDFAGLTDFKGRRAAHLSGGMQKKLALACTLIHEPEILLLDEPTTGVDPISRREFWDILTELYSHGTTIVVSTPYMDEADRCSRVGLMYSGKMVICDTPQVIKSQIHGELIQITPDDWRAATELLKDQSGIYDIQTYGESLHILVDDAEKRLPEISKSLKDNGLTYRGARATPAGMEEAFISLIKEMET
jgi:ABC-2 type transport system ATP-binding protein